MELWSVENNTKFMKSLEIKALYSKFSNKEKIIQNFRNQNISFSTCNDGVWTFTRINNTIKTFL